MFNRNDCRYKYNPENLFATKIGEHVPSGFSIPTVSLFKSIENKQYLYMDKDCMKKFYKSL